MTFFNKHSPSKTATPTPVREIIDFTSQPGFKMYKDGRNDPTQNIATYNDKIMEDEIIRLVNQERQSKGLKPLVSDERLRVTSRYKSNDMYNKNYFTHVSPDGLDLVALFKQFNYKFSYIGENIFCIPRWPNNYIVTAQGIFLGWKNSPSHYENMMKPEFENIGVGITINVTGGIIKCLGTQHFSKL